MGKAIANVLSNFYGLKAQGRVSQGIEVSNEALKSQLDIEVDEVLKLNAQPLKDYLESKKLTPDHIENLADYLTEFATYQKGINLVYSIEIYKKVLELYAIVNDESSTFSFERKSKEETIKKILDH